MVLEVMHVFLVFIHEGGHIVQLHLQVHDLERKKYIPIYFNFNSHYITIGHKQ